MVSRMLALVMALLISAGSWAQLLPDTWDDGRPGVGTTQIEGIVGPAHTPEAARAYINADDWATLPPLNYIAPPYAADVLTGLRICIDPGHAGDANPNRERPSEGVMTMECALMLRDFLEASGATVIMTRQSGIDSPNEGNLRWRARLADRTDCDFFISIHQNASGRRTANYVSVWYHSRPDHPRAATDLARWVTMELHKTLRHHEPQHAGLYSSWLMYGPNEREVLADGRPMNTNEDQPAGFGVLRHCRVPAILIEGAFQSHPEGVQMLSDREYLRRIAWAIYSGVLNYCWAGVPSMALHEEQPAVVTGPKPEIRLSLDDGMHEGWAKNAPPRIHNDTLRIYIDNERAWLRYIPDLGEVYATPASDLEPGEHTLRLRVLNVWGNWSWPKEIPFTVAEPSL